MSNIHGYVEDLLRAYYNGRLADVFLCRRLHNYKGLLNSLLELREHGKYDKLRDRFIQYWGHSFFQTGLDKSFINELIECIKWMDCSKEKFCEKYEELLSIIEECPSNSLSIAQWKRFSGLMTANGLFRMGYVCRNKCVDRIKTHYGNNGIFSNFVVAMEEQNYELAGALLSKIRQNKSVQKWCRKDLEVFEDFYAIMTKQDTLLQSYMDATNIDKEYHDYINQKEVAIIGPSPAEIENIEKLKEKIIVRFNDRGKEILPEMQGNYPTQISFYNGGCGEWLQSNANNSFLYDLEYIVCQTAVRKYFPDDVKDKVKTAKNLNAIFLLGIPNALPFALFDFARYGKKTIEVYCSNLYLSKNIWSNKYNIHSQNEQKEMFWWPILAQHEMSTQFIFLQNMYKQGFIVADDELKWVLEHELKDYISKMEELWVMDVIPYKFNTKWKEKM